MIQIALIFLTLLLPVWAEGAVEVQPELEFSIPLGKNTTQAGFIPFDDSIQSYGPKPPFLEGPASIQMDSDRNLWVLDTAHISVKVFNAEGEFQKSYPFPVIEQQEYAYVDLCPLGKGRIILLDVENEWLVLTDGERTRKIPLRKDVTSTSLFPTELVHHHGNLFFRDMQSGGVYRMGGSKGEGPQFCVNHEQIYFSPFVGPEKEFLGYQAVFEDPEQLEFYTLGAKEEVPSYLFRSTSFAGLTGLKILDSSKNGFVVSVYRGGEAREFLTELLYFDYSGKVLKRAGLGFEKLHWSMPRQCLVGPDAFYAIELDKENLQLNFHRVPLY